MMFGTEEVTSACTITSPAAGPEGATAMPMHIEAQQVFPGALSLLDMSSVLPPQCAEALALS